MSGSDVPRLMDYIDHIVEAISRIIKYVEDIDEQAFVRDHMIQDAVIRNFEIIGEAARNVEKRYPEFADKHPEVPWAVAYEMRNVLAHGYFKVDLGVVWQTIMRDLPQLQAQVSRLRAELN
jgi:uncharacterized protein with HEPN domain